MDRHAVRDSCLAVLALVWLALSPENHAVVQILPEVSLTVDGRAIHDQASVVSHSTVRESLAAFSRAEDAVQKQELDLSRNSTRRATTSRLEAGRCAPDLGRSLHPLPWLVVHPSLLLGGEGVRIGGSVAWKITCTVGAVRHGTRVTLDS